MNTFVKLLLSLTVLLAVSAAVLGENISVVLPNGTSWRGDTTEQVTVKYKDGSEVTGFVTRSADLYIVLRIGGGPDDELFLPLSELVSVTSGNTPSSATEESTEDALGTSGDTASDSPGSSEAQADVPAENAKGPKGVFYLPLRDKPYGGSVGDAIRVEEVREIIAQADKEGPGQTIVLDIESGGGSVIEAIRICETIQAAKDRHTFVAWPGYAISAAAYASLACDRIVFKSTGRLGAITMHSNGQPVSDEMERRWTTMLEHTLEESGQSPHWAKAMVKNAGFLSYVKDPVTGECEHFNQYQGVPGEIILSTYAENCVVNWETAIDSCLAYGKADSKEELAKVLDLPSWNELGTGQELYDDWHDNLIRCKEHIRKTSAELGRLGEYNRLTQIKKTIDIYKSWLRWWKNAPNGCFGTIPMEKDLKKMIEELELERRNMAGRP
jgi:ATP-dependent protease ClpP protease subunit